MVDESKLVKQLGVGVLPVEVLPFLWRSTAERLTVLGVSLVVRGGEENPYVTDNGNLILDLTVEGGIGNPKDFGAQLKQVTGVVEHARKLGGRVVQEPQQAPGVSFALIADPQGHAVGLAQQG